MPIQQKALKAFEYWYKHLPIYPGAGGGPARGTIGAGLVVLERLKTEFNLDLDSHRAKGKSQFKGLSPATVKRILKEFKETRPFLKEGGRTNRGAPGDIAKMLEALTLLEGQPEATRNEVLTALQSFLVDKVREYHARQRFKLKYSRAKSTWQTIHELLQLARQTGRDGPLAQYLVGAKLQLKFPKVAIRNQSYSAADDQIKAPGDFIVGDTAFHVTVSPMPAVYEKSKANLDEGMKVYLLVPDGRLAAARQMAEGFAPGQMAVESIESFVSQNIEELAGFSQERAHQVRQLLDTYNQRVSQVETDKSLLIEIPKNLLE